MIILVLVYDYISISIIANIIFDYISYYDYISTTGIVIILLL